MSRYYNSDLDYISHHGILGQKWGQQNGPPYPLSDAKHYQVVKKSKKQSKDSAGGTFGADSSAGKPKKKMSFMQKHRAKKNLKKARDAKAKKKLAENERLAKEKAASDEREKLVNEGSATDIYNRRNELTNEQKQRAITRLNLDSQLENFYSKENSKKKSNVDKFIDATSKIIKVGSNTYGMAITAKKLYSLFDDSGPSYPPQKKKNSA